MICPNCNHKYSDTTKHVDGDCLDLKEELKELIEKAPFMSLWHLIKLLKELVGVK